MNKYQEISDDSWILRCKPIRQLREIQNKEKELLEKNASSQTCSRNASLKQEF